MQLVSTLRQCRSETLGAVKARSYGQLRSFGEHNQIAMASHRQIPWATSLSSPRISRAEITPVVRKRPRQQGKAERCHGKVPIAWELWASQVQTKNLAKKHPRVSQGALSQ